jgi:hypothetical protein
MIWRPPTDYRRRVLSTAASVVATGALLALLVHRSPLPVGAGRTAGTLRLLVPIAPLPAPALARRPTRGPVEGRAGRATQVPLPQSAALPRENALPVPDADVNAKAEWSMAPTPAASAPLRLDAATLRAAAAHSTGDVRRLAQRSGQTLDDATVSERERLASGIAGSAKGDCLGSNAGGSLLSLPFIAYSALAGKCK